MSLAEMAKKLQGETIPPEVLELRRMRKFIADHDYDEMNGRWAEVARMEAQGEKSTLEGRYRMLKCIKELDRDEGLIKLYSATLRTAEKLERAKSGAGAAFFKEHQERIHEVEKLICKEAEEWQNMQVSIAELLQMEGGTAVGASADGGIIEDVRGNGAYCP